ncbi:hypothetical protein F4778DRAFT_778431 [Xylariomycetidae sp. FL2044]|nr:hypothetical protein F4778DRAFT_778431 [Xylariomycetidae sp. FL2044]
MGCLLRDLNHCGMNHRGLDHRDLNHRDLNHHDLNHRDLDHLVPKSLFRYLSHLVLGRNLSALLQQRKRPWKQLSPEERRQIWVAEHDPVKFDSYIYGPLNAPYHPKDPRFGLPEIRYPEPRPVRPATHFMHLDARVHYSKRYSSDWHHDKQKEIRGRGNRKAKENFGRAAARSAAVAPTRPSKKLPKHVRENPKWMEALAELDEMADRAQARKRENAREKEHTEGKGKPRSGKRGQKIRQTNTRENVEEEGGAPAESSPKPGPKNDATKGDKGKGKDVEQHTPEGKGKEKETISQRPRPRYMLPRVETESEYEDADDEMDWD